MAFASCLDSSLYRRVCSLVLFTTSCSVAIMTVWKMAPHNDDDAHQLSGDFAEDGGLLFEPARETTSPRTSASVSMLGVAEPRPPSPDLRRVSLRFFASSTIKTSSRAGVPSSTAGINRQTHKRWFGQHEAIGKLTRDGLGKHTQTE